MAPKMLIKNIKDTPAVTVDMDGAKDTKVRVLFGPRDGAPTFAMRLFELAAAGHTPYHKHPFEHQVVVLLGELAIITEEGKIPITVGDVVMVAPGEKHQFRNLSDTEPAKMLCIIPVEYQK
jgi:quercetin dioxygenase-like cupin family protein